jgi:hypothetical protein
LDAHLVQPESIVINKAKKQRRKHPPPKKPSFSFCERAEFELNDCANGLPENKVAVRNFSELCEIDDEK